MKSEENNDEWYYKIYNKFSKYIKKIFKIVKNKFYSRYGLKRPNQSIKNNNYINNYKKLS